MSSRRSANFTHHEKEILLSLMQTYRHIVEDKRTDGIMVKEKNAAWIELTNKYNAQNEVWTRSVKQLRQCWKNLKSRARIDLMRVNLQTTTSDSDPNSVRLNLVPLNNVSKPTDNSNHSSNNINNTTVSIINSNNTSNNINSANNTTNPPNIILSSILNNNNNSNTIKSGSVPSYGSQLQALSSTTGSNSVVGLSPSLLRGGSLSNRPNSKTSGSKKRKKKKVVLDDVSSRNFATNDNNSNSNSSSRRQQRLLTVSSATIGVERDDVDDEDDADDDDEEDDTVAVLAAVNDDDSNTIGARRRRRRRLHPTSKSTSISDGALVDVADENEEFDEDEDEEDEDEEDDVEGDEVDDDDDDDIDDSGTVDDDIYNDEDVRRSSRHHRSGVAVDSFHVEQNSDPSSQPGPGQDVDPLYSVENLAVVSVSGSADRIHFQHHANSPTSDLQNQTDGNLLHSHHPHHQSQHHQQQHQPPHLHSQVNNYHHSNRLSADSITRLEDDFSSTEPDIKVFDSIRGFGKVLHSQSSFSNQIVNNNSVNFTPSINYSSDISDLNGVPAASQSGPLIVSAHSENGGQMPAIEPVLVEKVNDHDMLLDDLRKTEHAEKMKNIRLERKLINVEHKARMGLIKLKSEYIKLKMDFLLQNKR
ncbi:putative uncharacterized protein DDB_G0282133 [Octopus bimaculoides]|uniref:Myb/SANT-like DNA-binding domain-containing protein n=1 Tax=Octopus bimaculoides TaxID=37653 RepID=A0A0L8GZG4_OCTBM|nr:putative uncharacterized protein DDB_G0282133 [Octopus bimaculoides]XP_014777016.1 putative uncharacterized protein DDB_G0282133 [Octopus bimaculoides]XP_014777017.1 putative uncharacterized protein DDB_G0282133 [Octopus bimaculoides]XP_014777018.1 putative uncharacterized protein DDB_G0282133 [Octopus bimaculoides]|eukprot:XP_014777015.1 PREDICTED: putative uncharacterized protein DDB_G0282133 [Octopus bimaculoides]